MHTFIHILSMKMTIDIKRDKNKNFKEHFTVSIHQNDWYMISIREQKRLSVVCNAVKRDLVYNWYKKVIEKLFY